VPKAINPARTRGAANNTAAKRSGKVTLGKTGAAGEGDQADPRFAPVAAAFARTPGFSLMQSKSQATRGLMLNGKSFGMSSHGRFILKLNEARVAALIGAGVGQPFSPVAGRIMKGWIDVTDPKADWVALAREAYGLASAAPGKRRPAR
jgi:hypothetical protein